MTIIIRLGDTFYNIEADLADSEVDHLFVHRSTSYRRMYSCSDSITGLGVPRSQATTKEDAIKNAVHEIRKVGMDKYNSLRANMLPIPDKPYETFTFLPHKEESVNEIAAYYEIPYLKVDIDKIVDDEGYLLEEINLKKVGEVAAAIWCGINLGHGVVPTTMAMMLGKMARSIAHSIAKKNE
jgi:hypothetical protein